MKIKKKVARGFKEKSHIGLANCVGAIDGMLLWIHKPNKNDLEDNIGFGPKNFFCGRKKKFGLNMMGTCDSRGYFMDVEIRFPGSSSDFCAFLNSSLKKKLEQVFFLANGLCLYGDNAYVNTPYMVVPFKGSVDESKVNYFHSSLRINIECAFGILVHRWGILRKPIPVNITIQKTTSLLMCLCKLHNFCIHESESIVQPLMKDVINIRMEGGFALSNFDRNETSWSYEQNEDRVEDLLDVGQHFGDITRNARRTA
mmetsp:Transcript_5526/g.7064  ORF Transcript_5526/g.7064 Transcript_5526/m.7064 type:complete len:256 (-) Transcript_5526:102-869(-)